MASSPAPQADDTPGPTAPRRPDPRDVPKRTPLVARPVAVHDTGAAPADRAEEAPGRRR